MPRHVYFVAPEKPAPTGGMNVIYQFAEILRDHGWAVSVHYSSPDYFYPFFESDVATTWSRYAEPLPPIYRSPTRHYRHWRWLMQKPRRRGANRLSAPGPDDLVVLPDYAAARQLSRFPGVPLAVLAQDVGGTIRGSLLPFLDAGVGTADFRGYVTTSRAAHDAVTAFSDAPIWNVPLFLDPSGYGFRQEKKRQMCFFPRKRADEVAAMTAFLRSGLRGRGIDLVAISRLPTPEVRRVLGESLFFLSFSRREGFGLPPAEAMAMGCLAIGYTGVGGNEYFTPDVAFPVPDDDIVGFYRKVIEVVDRYDADPTPLDAMRRRASDRILATYSKENTISALLKAFEEIATQPTPRRR